MVGGFGGVAAAVPRILSSDCDTGTVVRHGAVAMALVGLAVAVVGVHPVSSHMAGHPPVGAPRRVDARGSGTLPDVLSRALARMAAKEAVRDAMEAQVELLNAGLQVHRAPEAQTPGRSPR